MSMSRKFKRRLVAYLVAVAVGVIRVKYHEIDVNPLLSRLREDTGDAGDSHHHLNLNSTKFSRNTNGDEGSLEGRLRKKLLEGYRGLNRDGKSRSDFCSILPEPTPTSLSLWSHHISRILEATRVPQDEDFQFHDFYASLLHILTPDRMQRAVKSLPLGTIFASFWHKTMQREVCNFHVYVT